jgi:hypothetical protein
MSTPNSFLHMTTLFFSNLRFSKESSISNSQIIRRETNSLEIPNFGSLRNSISLMLAITSSPLKSATTSFLRIKFVSHKFFRKNQIRQPHIYSFLLLLHWLISLLLNGGFGHGKKIIASEMN